MYYIGARNHLKRTELTYTMETSTLVLSVIFCVCSLFLTIPPGCTHLEMHKV